MSSKSRDAARGEESERISLLGRLGKGYSPLVFANAVVFPCDTWGPSGLPHVSLHEAVQVFRHWHCVAVPTPRTTPLVILVIKRSSEHAQSFKAHAHGWKLLPYKSFTTGVWHAELRSSLAEHFKGSPLESPFASVLRLASLDLEGVQAVHL